MIRPRDVLLRRSGALARALCAFGFVLSASRTAAQSQGAITSGVIAGVAASHRPSPRGVQLEIEGKELLDWVDVGTDSTSRLSRACDGVVTELVLSGRSTRNFLNVSVLNETPTQIAFLPSQTEVRFGDGTVRRLLPATESDFAIEPDWRLHTVLRFPEKADFRGQRELEVRLSFEQKNQPPCVAVTRFVRAPGLPEREASYTTYALLELEFDAGLRFFATSGMRALAGDRGPILHLEFGVFSSVHHGLSLDIAIDRYGDAAIRRAAPTLMLDANPVVSGAGFLVGYLGRVYFTPWLSATYQAATGPYVFELDDDGKTGPKLSTLVFPLRQRLRLSGRFAVIEDGTEFSVAASLINLIVFYGKFGLVDTHGTTLGATLSILVSG